MGAQYARWLVAKGNIFSPRWAMTALTAFTYLSSDLRWARYLDLTHRPEAAERLERMERFLGAGNGRRRTRSKNRAVSAAALPPERPSPCGSGTVSSND